MKVRNDEGFLFPNSQYDFRGGLHGLGALNGSPAFEAAIRAQTAKFNYQLKKATQEEWLAAAGAVPADITDAEIEKAIRIGYEYAVNGQAAGDAMRAAEEQNIQAAAAQQAANAAATAAAQAAAQQAAAAADAAARQAAAQAESAARRAAEQAQADEVAKAAAATKNAMAVQAVIDAQLRAQQAAAAAAAAAATTTTAAVTVDYFLDSDGSSEFVIERRNNGTPTFVAGKSGLPTVDAWLTSRNLTRDPMNKTAAFNTFDTARRTAAAAATTTQKTAVNTTTGTVQTVDTVSGTTSTVNAATGSVRLTLSDGTTATGTGSVTAGGVTTKVDTKTGVVTTQNTNTGVATQTNAGTGQTQTGTQVTGTAATGGTFILPDGKTTVTTTQPITGGGLSAGHLALVGLVGLLLLRGAIK
jgi:hypothetical protein